MNRIVPVLVLFFSAPALSALSAEPLEARHGYIIEKEVLEPENNIPAGAIIGGIIGLATAGGKSSGTKARRAVGGAVVGGVVANQVDRSKRQWLYTVEYPGGENVQLLVDDDQAGLGDCVLVRQGRRATTMQYSSGYFCEKEFKQANEPVRISAPEPSSVSEAADDLCLAARRRLLDAETDVDIAREERKVRALCQ